MLTPATSCDRGVRAWALAALDVCRGVARPYLMSAAKSRRGCMGGATATLASAHDLCLCSNAEPRAPNINPSHLQCLGPCPHQTKGESRQGCHRLSLLAGKPTQALAHCAVLSRARASLCLHSTGASGVATGLRLCLTPTARKCHCCTVAAAGQLHTHLGRCSAPGGQRRIACSCASRSTSC